MVFTVASQPPVFGVEVQRWVLDSPAQLSGLRASLQHALRNRPEPAAGYGWNDRWEKIAVVVTELATNALKHALPPTIVRLCHVDHDPMSEPAFAVHRVSGQGGLGLRLARDLALDIGWYTAGTTKHVWARFPAPYTNQRNNRDPHDIPAL